MLLKTHTMAKLEKLRLTGMLNALQQQEESKQYHDLDFDERLGMLVDQEDDYRSNKQLARRLKNAKLENESCVANINFKVKRNLDKRLVLQLATSDWVRENLNIILTGATGAGKSFIASSLCHQACLNGFQSYFIRVHRLLEELSMGRIDGSYTKVMASLAKKHILVLDDFGISQLDAQNRRDLLEIVEDRHGKTSTIITSQYPIEKWHEKIGDPTLADAILDRVVHNAYRIELVGESMRKLTSKLTIKEK